VLFGASSMSFYKGYNKYQDEMANKKKSLLLQDTKNKMTPTEESLRQHNKQSNTINLITSPINNNNKDNKEDIENPIHLTDFDQMNHNDTDGETKRETNQQQPQLQSSLEETKEEGKEGVDQEEGGHQIQSMSISCNGTSSIVLQGLNGTKSAVDSHIPPTSLTATTVAVTGSGTTTNITGHPPIDKLNERQFSNTSWLSLFSNKDMILVPPALGIAIFCMWISYTSVQLGLQQTNICSLANSLLEVLLYVPLTCCIFWMITFYLGNNDGSRLSTISSFSRLKDLLGWRTFTRISDSATPTPPTATPAASTTTMNNNNPPHQHRQHSTSFTTTISSSTPVGGGNTRSTDAMMFPGNQPPVVLTNQYPTVSIDQPMTDRLKSPLSSTFFEANHELNSMNTTSNSNHIHALNNAVITTTNPSIHPSHIPHQHSDPAYFDRYYSSNVNQFDLMGNAVYLCIAVVFIGIICGLLGIGGGELLSPLMLGMHLLPQVTSATSAMLSFLNTLSEVLGVLAKGVHSPMLGIYFCMGFFGGLTGRQAGLYISNTYGRSSFIIFALVGVLYLSCVYYIKELSTKNLDRSIGKYCESS
jgi:hypothetical protein